MELKIKQMPAQRQTWMPRNLEGVSQFKITAKIRPNRDVYLKISI